MENDTTLRLTIDGEPGMIDAKALEKALGAVTKLLNAVGGKHTRHTVAGLAIGSVVVDISAEKDTRQVVLEGLSALSSHRDPGGVFHRSALKAASELCAVSAMTSVRAVSFGGVDHPLAMDGRMQKHIEHTLGKVSLSLGSVQGELYRFNARKELEAGVLETTTGRAVTLELKRDQVQPVLALMQKQVQVWGLVSRDAWTNDIIAVKVQGIEEVAFEEPTSLRAVDVQGILGSEWLDGLTPAELLRRERGA